MSHLGMRHFLTYTTATLSLVLGPTACGSATPQRDESDIVNGVEQDAAEFRAIDALALSKAPRPDVTAPFEPFCTATEDGRCEATESVRCIKTNERPAVVRTDCAKAGLVCRKATNAPAECAKP